MPRQSEWPAEDLVSRLKEKPILDCAGKLKPKKNEIWTEIKMALRLKMSAESVYLFAYKQGLGKITLETHIKLQSKKQKIKSIQDPDYHPYSDNNNPYNCEELNFRVILPTHSIIDFDARKKCKDWTDTLREKIWDSQKLPCAFNLKNSYISGDQLIFSGFCSDCGSGISGEGKVVDSEYLLFDIRAFATYPINHTKKNKLAGIYASDLVCMHAV